MQDDVMKRQTTIINFLRNGGKTFNEIKHHLEIESEIQGAELEISTRTFQRDIVSIRKLYGVDIYYDRRQRLYVADFSAVTPNSERLMESFTLLNTLKVSEHLSKYIHLEKRKPGGTHFILDIITAIKNRNLIEILHQKYDRQEAKRYTLKPLMLKEYRYRWYLVATKQDETKIKTFGLDRILLIRQLDKHYDYPRDFDAEQYFNDFYGVITPDNMPTETVELSFTRFQGNYIKSLPMHPSQKILKDTEDELRVSLTIKPTLDFIMDLQYFGDNVKVLKPKWLADEIVRNFKHAIGRYEG